MITQQLVGDVTCIILDVNQVLQQNIDADRLSEFGTAFEINTKNTILVAEIFAGFSAGFFLWYSFLQSSTSFHWKKLGIIYIIKPNFYSLVQNIQTRYLTSSSVTETF